MRYCFISELVNTVERDDPYWIQRQYALRINKYIEYSFDNDCFYDCNKKCIQSPKEKVFWVGDCLYADAMDDVTITYGMDSIDNKESRKQIRQWYKHGLTKRNLFSTDKKGVLEYAKQTKKFFVKTERKGRSAVIQDSDESLSWFLGEEDTYVVADYVDIVEDKIGKVEMRFIVFEGKILNGSRSVHSIYHTIDDRFFMETEKLKKKIDCIEFFPDSYVMDVAMFRDDNNEEYFDIVEINALSTSMCYVNNSFFTDKIPDIEQIYKKTGFGYEYCYDFLLNEDRYYLRVNNPKDFVYCRG